MLRSTIVHLSKSIALTMLLYLALQPRYACEAASIEFQNNTNRKVSFAILYKATVPDYASFSSGFGTFSRGRGFWIVPPGGRKKVDFGIDSAGSFDEVWVSHQGIVSGGRKSVTLSRAQYSPRDQAVIAELPKQHSLITWGRSSLNYSGAIRVDPQHLGDALVSGKRFTFYRTHFRGNKDFTYSISEDAPNSAETSPAAKRRGYQLYFNGIQVGHEPDWTLKEAIANLKGNVDKKRNIRIYATYNGQPLTRGYRLFFSGRLVGYEPYWSREQALANLRGNQTKPGVQATGYYDGKLLQ